MGREQRQLNETSVYKESNDDGEDDMGVGREPVEWTNRRSGVTERKKTSVWNEKSCLFETSCLPISAF